MKQTQHCFTGIRSFLLLFSFILLFASCTKDGLPLNFSNIYQTDSQGNLRGGDVSDGQWQSKTFSEKEMALFNDLDTTNVAGTLKPTTLQVRYPVPNPFVDYIGLSATLDPDYNGELVVKYVVVDRYMQEVQKGAIQLGATSHAYLAINPTFKAGKYRLYFTYSAEGEEHFYKSWGNIERQ